MEVTIVVMEGNADDKGVASCRSKNARRDLPRLVRLSVEARDPQCTPVWASLSEPTTLEMNRGRARYLPEVPVLSTFPHFSPQPMSCSIATFSLFTTKSPPDSPLTTHHQPLHHPSTHPTASDLTNILSTTNRRVSGLCYPPVFVSLLSLNVPSVQSHKHHWTVCRVVARGVSASFYFAAFSPHFPPFQSSSGCLLTPNAHPARIPARRHCENPSPKRKGNRSGNKRPRGLTFASAFAQERLPIAQPVWRKHIFPSHCASHREVCGRAA